MVGAGALEAGASDGDTAGDGLEEDGLAASAEETEKETIFPGISRDISCSRSSDLGTNILSESLHWSTALGARCLFHRAV